MNLNWNTIIISIVGSGVLAAVVSGLINYHTQIKAIKESGLYAKRASVLDKMMEKMEQLHRFMGGSFLFFKKMAQTKQKWVVARKHPRPSMIFSVIINRINIIYQKNYLT